MKIIILLFVTSVCFAGRGNYIPESKMDKYGVAKGNPVYRLSSKCLKHYKEECIDITGMKFKVKPRVKTKREKAVDMLKTYDCKDYNFCKLLKDYLGL